MGLLFRNDRGISLWLNLHITPAPGCGPGRNKQVPMEFGTQAWAPCE